MPFSIKQQIMDYVLSALEPLRTSGTVRDISRELDHLSDARSLPALLVYDSDEKTYSKTDTVWSCRFELVIIIVFPWQRDPGSKKDTLVAEVQKKIEADLTLGGTARIMDAGNETPLPAEKHRTTQRTFVTYTIQYSRKIGDPYSSS